MKARDFSGSKVGALTVLEKWDSIKSFYKGKASSKTTWLCLCDCGEFKVSRTTYLANKKDGAQCAKCAYASRPQSTQRLSGMQRLYNLTVAQSFRRGIENKLSIIEFGAIVSQNCRYCGEEPPLLNYITNGNKHARNELIYANGVDRVDSNGPYEKENCVPCCKQCNIMKHVFTFEEFINRCKKILVYLKIDNTPASNNE